MAYFSVFSQVWSHANVYFPPFSKRGALGPGLRECFLELQDMPLSAEERIRMRGWIRKIISVSLVCLNKSLMVVALSPQDKDQFTVSHDAEMCSYRMTKSTTKHLCMEPQHMCTRVPSCISQASAPRPRDSEHIVFCLGHMSVRIV